MSVSVRDGIISGAPSSEAECVHTHVDATSTMLRVLTSDACTADACTAASPLALPACGCVAQRRHRCERLVRSVVQVTPSVRQRREHHACAALQVTCVVLALRVAIRIPTSKADARPRHLTQER